MVAYPGVSPAFAPTGVTGAVAASRYVGGTTSGKPVTGTFSVGDYVVDETGHIWICSVAGSPGTWVEVGSLLATVLNQNAGSNSSGSAPALTPTFANGTAAQLSDLTRDYMVYLEVGTAGTAFVVAIGPTSGVANTVVASGTATSGELVSVRLPAGWFLKWSATTATLANQLAIGC